MIAAWIMDVIPDENLRKTNQTLKAIYRFFPPFLMADSFKGLSTREFDILYGYPRKPYDWIITGRNLFLMFIEGVGYFSLLLVIEFSSKSKVCLKTTKKFQSLDTYKAPYELDDSQLDEDVLNEKNRLIQKDNTNEERDPIELVGLRKTYVGGGYSKPPTVAIQNLHYSVKKGQVFGFLGLNGAGKSSTLNILSGNLTPTSGNAYLNGYSIDNQIAVRQSLGFCPQFSALFPRLTVNEHLYFYGKIKGVPTDKIKILAKHLINDLSLNKYINRQARKLSGGNQRKLSVAIALIGNPPIVLLGIILYIYIYTSIYV